MYMTYFAIGGDDYRQTMYHLLETTEVNAVVIDVKGDYGLLSYRSTVPLAQQIGANDEPTIDDLDGLLKSIHDRGGYAIARIVVFKDTMLAHNGHKAGLDLGVKDRRTGELWQDGEKLAWVDPFQQAAWDHHCPGTRGGRARLTKSSSTTSASPPDPSPESSIGDIVHSQPLTGGELAALRGFSSAHRAANDAGGYLGMDTFGYTTVDRRRGIGRLEILADNLTTTVR
jgi:hypothetical protein